MHRNIALFIATLGLSVSLPQMVLAKNVEDSIAQAIQEHPAIIAAQAETAVQAQNVKEAKSGYYPHISVQGNFGRIDMNNDTTRSETADGGADQSWSGDGRLAVTQRLYDGFQTGHKYKAEKIRYQSAEKQTEAEIDILALRAAQAHLNVMRLRDQMYMTQKKLTLFEALRKKIQAKFDAGASDETALLQADEVMTALQAKQIDLEKQYHAAQASYYEVVGGEIENDLSLDIDVFSHAMPQEVKQAVHTAFQQHPALAALNLQLEASVKDIKAEKSAIIPRFDAEISYFEKDIHDNLSGEVETAQALVKMSWDFSAGGAYQARVEKSRQQHQASAAEFAKKKREIERDVYAKYHALNQNKRHLRLVLKREKTLENLLVKYQEQFDGGKISILQIMTAQNSLMGAASQRIDAFYAHQLSKYELLAAMGGLRHATSVKPMQTAALSE